MHYDVAVNLTRRSNLSMLKIGNDLVGHPTINVLFLVPLRRLSRQGEIVRNGRLASRGRRRSTPALLDALRVKP